MMVWIWFSLNGEWCLWACVSPANKNRKKTIGMIIKGITAMLRQMKLF